MSPQDEDAVNEHSQLLLPRVAELSGRRGSRRDNHSHFEDAESIISSHLSKEEEALGSTAIGERLPYNDYTTIDWLHDLASNIRFATSISLTDSRLKTRFGTVPSNPEEGSKDEYSQDGMLPRAGLPLL